MKINYKVKEPPKIGDRIILRDPVGDAKLLGPKYATYEEVRVDIQSNPPTVIGFIKDKFDIDCVICDYKGEWKLPLTTIVKYEDKV